MPNPEVTDEGHVVAPPVPASSQDLQPAAEKPADGAASPKPTQTTGTGDQGQVAIEQKGGEVVEFNVDDLERDAEGNFVFRVGSEEGSIYKAKSIPELFKNIKQGIEAKDSTITKYKAEKISADSHKGRVGVKGGQGPEPEIEIPTREEILNQTIQQYTNTGVKPEMFLWTEADWQKFETENGARNTMKLSNLVDQVRQVAEQRYAEANIIALNDLNLDDETDQVRALLADYGIDPEKDGFDYRAVLERVHSDEKNFKANGVRKNAVIVREAMKDIRRISQTKSQAAAKQALDEKLAAGAGKPKPKSEGPTRVASPAPSSTRAPAKTMDEVVENILKEQRGGK